MRVMLAVDYSQTSVFAGQYLRTLPFHRSVDLQVVTVLPPFPFMENAASDGPVPIENLLEQARQQAESTLAESMARFHPDSFRSVTGEVMVGAPGQSLTAFAKQHGIDLIVMGAVGRSALSRVLLGSVSEYVSNRTDSSVMIVRSQGSKSGVDEIETVPKRVLLALGNSDQDVNNADWIKRLELPAATEIHLVHVMELLTFYRKDIVQRATESWRQSKAAAVSRANSLAQSIRTLDFDAQPVVMEAPHVGDALLSYADQHHCDLIITGDRRRGTLNQLFLGSVSLHVLRHAKCSVLVSRAA